MQRAVAAILLAMGMACWAQTLPPTEGETLAGQRIVLAEAVHGHPAVLLISFSREAGAASDAWSQKLLSDPAFTSVTVYRAAVLEAAPGFVRGWIKAALRRQISSAEQQHYVVLIHDEAQWRDVCGAGSDKGSLDKLPCVLLLGADGQVRWRGQGTADFLLPLLKTTMQ
jgi:hypothetical protein